VGGRTEGERIVTCVGSAPIEPDITLSLVVKLARIFASSRSVVLALSFLVLLAPNMGLELSL
jgi:hypothetical protein